VQDKRIYNRPKREGNKREFRFMYSSSQFAYNDRPYHSHETKRKSVQSSKSTYDEFRASMEKFVISTVTIINALTLEIANLKQVKSSDDFITSLQDKIVKLNAKKTNFVKEIRLYNLYCVRKREKSSIKLLQIDSGNYLKDRASPNRDLSLILN
jgi:hypothetical protein